MRVYDNGSMFTVSCSRNDVEQFARQWPCFGRIEPLWFQYEKRNGDLVDTNQRDGRQDGSGVVALSDDAMRYGAAKLGIDLSWR